MLEVVERVGSMTELVDVVVYYLEMRAPSHQSVPAPREGLTILHVRTPSVPYYRFLYDAVGKDYHWLSRRKLSDTELAAIIQDPRNELHVLHVDGSPAGFAELDRRQPEEVEMVQFGLMGNSSDKGSASGSCNGPSTPHGATSRDASGCTHARWIIPPPYPSTRRPDSWSSRSRRFAGTVMLAAGEWGLREERLPGQLRDGSDRI